MDIHFKEKRVLVTGAARGIGRAICEAFAADGAHVTATDVLDDELASLVSEARPARGGSIRAIHLDVTDETAIAELATEAENAGGFDVFVHVAGGVLGQKKRPLEEVPAADWDRIYDINVRGAFLVARPSFQR